MPTARARPPAQWCDDSAGNESSCDAKLRGRASCLVALHRAPHGSIEAARGIGRTLLLLDTQADSAGDKLYRRCGWIPMGIVPDHAFTPDGQLAPTTFFYKQV